MVGEDDVVPPECGGCWTPPVLQARRSMVGVVTLRAERCWWRTAPGKSTRVSALAGIFLVVSMCATLQAHTLAAALCGKGHAFGSGGTGSAFAVGFSNDFVAHGTLSSLVKLAIVPHSLGLFLAARNRQRI